MLHTPAVARGHRLRLPATLSVAIDVAEDALRSAAAVVIVRGLLRDALPEVPLPTLLSTITPQRRPARHRQIPRPTRWAVQGVDAVAARALGPSTCLFRALAHYAALCQARVDVRFVMGVIPGAPGNEPFVAHAWVEVDGEAVWERAPPRYHETFCYPPR